eukprot:scaffold39570_cov31-Phaeocystis_antarctica.AAC.1
MSRPALCSPLNSLRPVLKTAPLRFHEGLVSSGAPLGSPNGASATGRIQCEPSEVGVAISSGEFGISADLREFSFRAIETSASYPQIALKLTARNEKSARNYESRNVLTQHARRRGGDACGVLARHRASAATVQVAKYRRTRTKPRAP